MFLGADNRSRLVSGSDHGVDVQRFDRGHVEYAGLDTSLLELFCGAQGRLEHESAGDQRDVAAVAELIGSSEVKRRAVGVDDGQFWGDRDGCTRDRRPRRRLG